MIVIISSDQLHESQERVSLRMYMDDIKLFAKNKKELKTQIQAVRIYSDDGIWHRKMWRANNEKRKTTNEWRNRSTEWKKKRNARKKEDLLPLENIGSGDHQTSGNEIIF